ncbi:S-adenosyl-L-methionine-dependent methyltransferase [Neolentinus lepideus HHB14362 ss-1]|uniref:S-adenosyl-L-methionine-dependent methyltransferase n=1 Tax=Neolentinus lepideus HHB14362 ss-1 TaxID=1314782 RepID=A0A165SVB6_9AGAM|nr:S-adenosyl-L-methionine-dependent methyltransferase [Neolentinus lepideus HHB14362 ss-1]
MDDAQQLKILHGRGRNTMNEVYKLPADLSEMDRLALQHRMWKLLVGGLYPPELTEVVAQLLMPQEGSRPKVLDVGSGSGSWIVEMAQANPDADFVGFDLVKSEGIDAPPNCSFIIGDLTGGLPDFQAAFDIVHTRSVVGHLLDPEAGLYIIAGCVKPGGLLIFADGDLCTYDSERRFLQAAVDGEDNAGRCWFARWSNEWAKQIYPNGRYSMEDRVKYLKKDSRIDPEKAGGVVHRQYFAPVNWPGEGVEHGNEIGQIMKINLTSLRVWNIWQRFVDACKPSFLASGYDPETVERWVNEIQEEMDGPKLRYYVPWHVTSASRRVE